MGPDLNRHIPEEILDELALGMVAEGDAAFWEEHLLVCTACQDRLAEADEYICLMKSAAMALAQASAGSHVQKPLLAAMTHAASLGLMFFPH